MLRTLFLSAAAFAGIVSQPPGQAQPPATGQPVSGVLMDASCSAIKLRNSKTASSNSSLKTDEGKPTTRSSSGGDQIADTSERSRTVAPGTMRSDVSDSVSFTSVREKYKHCMVTANSKEFAIHSEGRLYVIDKAGNDMIRQQMANEAFRAAMTDSAGASKWMTVTVIGAADGDQLNITSVRK